MTEAVDLITNKSQKLPPEPAEVAARPERLLKNGEKSIAPKNIVTMGWGDLVDTINPLQQLPVIGEVYRAVTGDKISGVARMVGGILYGGVVGGAVAAATSTYAQMHDGVGPGETLVAHLLGLEDGAKTQVAEAKSGDSAAQQKVAELAQPASANESKSIASDRETEMPQEKSAPTLPAADMALAQNALDKIMPLGNSEKAAESVKRLAHDNANEAEAEIRVASAPLLRDRLNQKKATNITTQPKELSELSSNLLSSRMVGQQALAQAQGLQMMQGISDLPPVIAETNSANASGHNAMIEDMMLGALSKYQDLKRVSSFAE